MAAGKNGKKANATSFKPGNPGGPGRPAITLEEKQRRANIEMFHAIREQAGLDIQEKIEMYRYMPIEELEVLYETKKLPADEQVIVAGFIGSSDKKKADLTSVQMLKTIAAGPEAKQLQLTGANGESLNTAAPSITREEMIIAWRELLRQAKERECQTQSLQVLSESPQRSLPPSSVTESPERKSDD